MEKAFRSQPVKQPPAHTDLRQWRIKQAIQVFAPRACAEIYPVRNTIIYIGLGRGKDRNRNVCDSLPTVLDVAQRIHHFHPWCQFPQESSRLLVILELLATPRFIRHMEERVISRQMFLVQETSECRQILPKKIAEYARRSVSFRRPQERPLISLTPIDVNRILHSPVKPKMRELEIFHATALGHIDKATDVAEIKFVLAGRRLGDFQQLRRPGYYLATGVEDRHHDHV